MRACNPQSSFDDAVWLLDHMAKPSRLSILICLTGGSRTLSEIAKQSGLRCGVVSFDLRGLIEDGLVIRKMVAKQVSYSCSSAAVPTIIAALETYFR